MLADERMMKAGIIKALMRQALQSIAYLELAQINCTFAAI